MARRRLSSVPLAPDGSDVPRAEHSAARGTDAAGTRAAVPAPIAHVAGEAAAAAAFEEVAETLRAAREEGRMVLDLPLDAVAPDHLVRDRLPAEDEEMAALKDSLRTHGQRTPIEVTPLAGPLPYGLISGWRRLAALKALHAETGDARFATVRALVMKPETAEAAYVAMVEENEIRVGLSYYERARVAALATRRGIFDSEKKALLALFATASRAKRSRIRAFLDIYHALDGTLRFPAALPERLGLKLVELVRAGGRARIAEAIERAEPATPEDEQKVLQDVIGAVAREPRRTPAEEIAPGVSLTTRRRGQALTLTLKGRGVTPDLEAEVRALLTRLHRSR